MSQDRTRKIAVAGIMGAITVFLGLTHWGFIPWFTGTALTIMQVPVVIGTVLEGPVVGVIIGLIFGLFSLLQAAIAPTGPGDVIFTNPLIAILPRLFIGPVAWLVWTALKRWTVPGLLAAGLAGALTNTFLVLGVIWVLGLATLAVIGPIVLANGIPEAILCAILVLVVITAWRQIRVGKKQGSSV